MLTSLRPLLLILLLPLLGAVQAAEWRYTDGADKTVVLENTPVRLIAHASVAAALMPYGIKPVGILLDGAPSRDRALEGLDIQDIPIVSQGWFDIDAEAILALDPDLIITEYSPIEKIYQGGVGEEAMAGRLEAIAPVIGIERSNSVMDILERYRDFAASMGAETATPTLLADKARLDAAIDNLRRVAAAKPGLTVAALSPGASSVSVAVPAYFGELNDFANWGVNLVSPEATPGTSYMTLSWEEIGRISADVLLLDDRWEQSPRQTMLDNPLGSRLPAIAAGQVGDWPAEWIRSSADYAEAIDTMARLIERSDPDLVP